MSKWIDLIYQRFGRLIVIEFSYKDKHGKGYWLCKCDCGNERIINGASLRYGYTRSCGCLKKEIARESIKKLHEKWRLPEGIAARNEAVRVHKYSAKQRNIEQVLTDEQIIAIHKENCHYCGAPPSNVSSAYDLNGSYTYSGIDRVDNDKGYTIDNVVSCCLNCNSAKRSLSYNEFLGLIKQIHSHLKL